MTERTREQWLKERRQGIGASDAAAVLGVSPWKSRYTLYQEKVGEASDHAEGEVLYWGERLEPVIRQAVEERLGCNVHCDGYMRWSHERHRWMAATLDGWFRDMSTGICNLFADAGNKVMPGGDGILEIKTTSAFNAGDWKEEFPLLYQVQVQHQLAVTGWDWGVLAVLIGGQKLEMFPFLRNERFIQALIAEEEKFWGLVQNRTPPEVDGSASTAATLKMLYPQDDGSQVELPDEALLWDARIEEAQAAKKEAQATLDECQAKIKDAIGEHTYGVLPDGSRWSWKLQQRKGYTVKPSETRVLRRLKK